ncbi:adenosine receptor A2b-like [Hydractinia symbiolongicarpus]|uniref:adenosine receptor A2b-like n=1 Tax=Hydractinia symbiolongicarpus TaxID=13093 RepID=UPI0025514054|nr:adenosine receptor A2b-like [Hydractinia symbiolongicarpus]
MSNKTISTYEIVCDNLEFMFSINGGYAVNIYINIILQFIINFSSCVLNTLVSIVIIRQKKLRTPSNILLLNNTISDALVGFMHLVFWLPCLIMALYQTHSCVFFVAMITLGYHCGAISLVNVDVIAVDRYIAIYKPYYYSENITGNLKVYVKFIIFQWVITAVLIGLSHLTPNFLIVLICAIITIPFTISWCSFVYTKVFLTVKELNSRDRATTRHLNQEDTQKMKEIRLAKITAAMILTLCACLTPFCLTSVLWLVAKVKFSPLVYALTLWALLLVSLKSLLNPVLFCLTLTDIKEAIKDLLCRHRKIGNKKSKSNGTTINAATTNISTGTTTITTKTAKPSKTTT